MLLIWLPYRCLSYFSVYYFLSDWMVRHLRHYIFMKAILLQFLEWQNNPLQVVLNQELILFPEWENNQCHLVLQQDYCQVSDYHQHLYGRQLIQRNLILLCENYYLPPYSCHQCQH